MDQLVLDCKLHDIMWAAIIRGEQCPMCILEGEMQTALDLLVESSSDKQAYDFNARREMFIGLQIRQRQIKVREIHDGKIS